jgi:hypothetical protein
VVFTGGRGKALSCNPEGCGFDSRCVTGMFHCHNPSGDTMNLGLTQPLTGMSNKNISWELKAASRLCWHYHFHVRIVLKSGTLNLLEPSGTVQACNGIALPSVALITPHVPPQSFTLWPLTFHTKPAISLLWERNQTPSTEVKNRERVGG